MITIGSLFAGIGGFELGIERAIPNSHTVWQVEQNPFCQSILRKHWPNAKIYDDVRTVGAHNLHPVDIIIGGYPCQSTSLAGNMRGLQDENKSGLWWHMHRIIGELKPRIVIIENVANAIRLGGTEVITSLANLGYNCEWSVISGAQCGAPHLRKRWFCVAYTNPMPNRTRAIANANGLGCRKTKHGRIATIDGTREKIHGGRSSGNESTQTYWQRTAAPQPTICAMDDGFSRGLDRATRRLHKQQLKALGNAIVPQCSQWIGHRVFKSGLLDDLINA
jgi:DNA (cytosine-5)-methyltransferase 1